MTTRAPAVLKTQKIKQSGKFPWKSYWKEWFAWNTLNNGKKTFLLVLRVFTLHLVGIQTFCETLWWRAPAWKEYSVLTFTIRMPQYFGGTGDICANLNISVQCLWLMEGWSLLWLFVLLGSVWHPTAPILSIVNIHDPAQVWFACEL